MYWSAVQVLRNKPDTTVDDTMLTRVLANFVNTFVILSNMPPAVMAPPKHMAQIINQMVSIMPDMPRVAINSLICSFPASKLVLVKRMVMTPLIMVNTLFPASPAISTNKFGWKKTAKTAANAVETNNVMIEGTFLAIIMAVANGTSISHPEIWNLLSNAWVNSAICPVSAASCDNPAIVKMTSVINNDGIVVNSKYRMCEKIGLPVTEAANTVVSERGETLSPK